MHDKVGNLFGATALAVTDLMLGTATMTAGASPSATAAVAVLLDSEPLGVTELGRRVGLTQSAAARMVDVLERRELVERRPGAGRSVAVHLTETGSAIARRLLAARNEALSAVLADLTPADRQTLATLLETVLTRLYAQIGSAARICRLCDRACCVQAGSICPVGQAERVHPARAAVPTVNRDGEDP